MSDQTRLPLLDVSPVLEFGSPTPLSTHWLPLHELLRHWTDSALLFGEPTPVAPLLAAVGYALFALSRETRALRLWTLAGQQEQQSLPALVTRQRCRQVACHLHKAASYWSRAAATLETLHSSDLNPSALDRARQLTHIARSQQERLWALTAEVCGTDASTRDPRRSHEQPPAEARYPDEP